MLKYIMYDTAWRFIRNIDAFNVLQAIENAETEGIEHYYLKEIK